VIATTNTESRSDVRILGIQSSSDRGSRAFRRVPRATAARWPGGTSRTDACAPGNTRCTRAGGRRPLLLRARGPSGPIG
jgi:hypothetical protein